MDDRNSSLLANLKGLEAETRQKFGSNDKADPLYRHLLNASYIKAYEFALFCNESLEARLALFVAATLRGICEEYVVLRYLDRPAALPSREERLRSIMLRTTASAVDSQRRFFSKHRPFQPIFAKPPAFCEKAKGLPPVRDMAKDVGCADIYDFLYSVTSDSVHFNPRALLRNSWTTDNKATEDFRHSHQNFERYYDQFCKIYSVYLLTEYCFFLSKNGDVSSEYLSLARSLRKTLDGQLRWPEAVTFEEMNAEGPSDAERVLLRVQHDYALRESQVSSGLTSSDGSSRPNKTST